MKRSFSKFLIYFFSFFIVLNSLTIFFLNSTKISSFVLLVVIIIDVLLISLNSIKVRYILMKRKKSIIYADINNSKLIKLYYGKKYAKKLFNNTERVINRIVKKGIIKRKNDSNYIILINSNNRKDLIDLVNKINNEIQKLMVDEIFNLTMKYGIQICSEESFELNENKAELACNIAKTKGTNYYSFYSSDDAIEQINEKKILNKLIYALKHNQFEVYYQPKYDMKEKKIVGSEALVRLVEDGKVVSAKDFIDIAEKHSFTILLDKYVLKEVCKKINILKNKKLSFGSISINVSRASLCEKNMIDYYYNMINDYGIKKSEIELEITEREINNSNSISDILSELCKKFNVAIDDFGIENSSLSMLNDNNYKTIKIDRKFIIDQTESGKKILSGIIKLSKDLGYKLVAEGVETKEQYDFLKSKGCNIIQGYYYSVPLNFSDYEKKIREEA